MKTALRWFGRAVLVLLVLLLGACASLFFPRVQTAVARWLAAELSDRMGATITIDRVALSIDGAVRLEGVFVGDLRGDTLFHVPSLGVRGLRVSTSDRTLTVSNLALRDARFNLVTAEGDANSNLTLLLNTLASEDSSASGGDWTIQCTRFDISGFHFSFHDANAVQAPFGVDFKHIDIPNATVQGYRFEAIGDSISALLDRAHFTERSGLRVEGLTGLAHVSPSGVVVEGMDLRTPMSRARGELKLLSQGWADFSDFTTNVQLRADFDSSLVDMADIAWFAPELEGIRFPMTVRGRVRGTVSELKGRDLRIGFGQGSWFEGSAELSGLPDIAETFMLIDVEDMHAALADLKQVPMPPFTSGTRLELPPEADLLGDVDVRGRFTGFLRSYTATGRASTALGVLRTDVSYNRDTITQRRSINGRMATEGFRLGPLLGTSLIGPLTANVQLKANGRALRDMEVDLEGDFPLFTINNRTIGGIHAKGHLARNLFDGELEADDPDLHLRFSGLADFRGRWPKVDFTAKLHNADLYHLGFVTEPGYSSLSLDAAVRGRLSPDSLLGDLHLKGITYCRGDDEFELGDVHLSSDRRDGENLLRLDASFAEAEVIGPFLPTKLPAALGHVLRSVFPSLLGTVSYAQDEQRFRFNVRLRDTKEVLRLFLPDAQIAPGATFSGSFDTRTFDLGLHAVMPSARYGATRFDSLVVIADKTLDLLAFSVKSTRQHFGDSLWFSGTGATGKAYQDELDIDLGWNASSGGTNGNLSFTGEVLGPKSVALELLPSRLFFGLGEWANTERAGIRIDSTTVRIHELDMRNGRQRVSLNGTIARDPQQALSFELDSLELANFAPLIDGPAINGTLSADGRLFDLYGTPHAVSAAKADSVRVAKTQVGDVALAVSWLEGQGALDLNGRVERGTIKALDFTGRLGLRDQGELDMLLLLDRFDLGLANPYLPEGLSSLAGHATGQVALTGTLAKPDLNGAIDLTAASLRIDYLNTRYTGDARVRIGDELFAVDRAIMRDDEGHIARVGATVAHIGLRDWSYDIWGALDRVQVLNTTEAMNSLYYGTAYATGDFNVSGSKGSLEVSVQAATAPGTDIHLPVGGSMEVSPISFVHFGPIDTTGAEADVDLTGVSLSMEVTVTPDARFELIFDPTVGDIMSGRGEGLVELGVTSRGDLSMSGMVTLTEGDYLFTLRNVVNKRFAVQPGGRITWYGDPFDAQLDLQAIYRLKAPLYDIVPPGERNDSHRQRVPVEVVMKLREKMMNPEIGFDVRLQQVDENLKAQVASVLSTDQEMGRQVFALIVLNRFLEPPLYAGAGAAAAGSTAGNTASTAASELLSNQVSNWLSGLSNDFDLGFNYRPGDAITQDELEVAFSKQFFNERLLFSTNVGVHYGAAQANATSALIGDFQLEYLITREGRFRARAFSLTNDRNLIQADQAPTTQGAGLVLRRDFDSLGDLFRRKKR
jgi:hypothetical protein